MREYYEHLSSALHESEYEYYTLNPKVRKLESSDVLATGDAAASAEEFALGAPAAVAGQAH